MPLFHSIFITKFLPDCKIISLDSAFKELTHIIESHSKLFGLDVSALNFECSPNELTEHYIHLMSVKYSWKKSGIIPWQNDRHKIKIYLTKLSKFFAPFNPPWKNTKGDIIIMLRKKPMIYGFFEPPSKRLNQCHDLMISLLEKGIVDLIRIHNQPNSTYINEKTRFTTITQSHWLYINTKILKFKNIRNVLYQVYLSETPSVLYSFAQKIRKVFFTHNLMKYSLEQSKWPCSFEPQCQFFQDSKQIMLEVLNTNKMPNKLWNIFNSKQKTMEYSFEAQAQTMREFVTKCDQILLEAWGNEKFSEMLEPLNVSLDEWLKAGKERKDVAVG
ncbi:hypothetical protein PN36_34065 [Candidatus Thiomargarita nelsonii]|uniref:Uncharacterized protein n=1 Tax=Candidatus Thiomargarita nelsonii TaxID=1003181 RepID=A0A0A6P455_9GAMM|nr:hypothetical protein PN36_34065 [Candidatus Thiomargarita nelsonii]